VIDATEKPIGRLASEVAQLLRGKHKPMYAPHMDVGDYVVVVNAARVGITGKNKPTQKMYYRHSGYLGSLRAVSLQRMMSSRPERVIEHAVKGMLPKTSLGRSMFRKLRVYAGPTHPHQGQVSASGVSESND
jgi:large subunit ribosomal protein L13